MGVLTTYNKESMKSNSLCLFISHFNKKQGIICSEVGGGRHENYCQQIRRILSTKKVRQTKLPKKIDFKDSVFSEVGCIGIPALHVGCEVFKMTLR